MAFTEAAATISLPSGTTFAAADLYKFVHLDSAGAAVLSAGSSNALPFGVLYGVTSTTNAGQAVEVAISGVVKVNMGASTLAAGGYVASSTLGVGVVASTDGYISGQIVSGSSGSAGRIHSVKLFNGPSAATI
jgi:hypothetical protein